MTYPLKQETLKTELSDALSEYTQLLRNVEQIETDNMDAFIFMMRSFGFIFQRVPGILITDEPEETYFGIFQYYNLLGELKRNLLMAYPYAQLGHKNLTEILAPFPTHFEKEINQWWETQTGLKVEVTKQTLNI